jgi:hypothetical protein
MRTRVAAGTNGKMRATKEWLVAFWQVTYHPFPQTFLNISKNARGQFAGAMAWLIFISIYAASFDYLSLLPGADLDLFLLKVFAGSVAIPILVLFYVYWIRFFHRKVFHRNKECCDELLYVITIIYVVTVFLSKLMTFVPISPEASMVIAYAYLLVLAAVAVQAITKLHLWETIAAVISSFLLTIATYFCALLFIFGLFSTLPTALR